MISAGFGGGCFGEVFVTGPGGEIHRQRTQSLEDLFVTSKMPISFETFAKTNFTEKSSAIAEPICDETCKGILALFEAQSTTPSAPRSLGPFGPHLGYPLQGAR